MKKRKILSLALALILMLGLAAPALALPYGQEYIGYTAEGGQQYSDVPDGHWAKTSIETCSQRGWFNGYPDGTFRPNGLIRRDEAAKVFAVAMGLTLEENPTATYTDTADSWAKAHIEATKALFPNVVNLQGTASFRPEQTITREETIYALLVAWRYASKTTNADLSVLNMFSDVNSISAGVKPYMAVAVSEGLVSGLPDGTIAAQKGLTRAEFAALLARALNHGYGSDTTDTPVITVNRYAAETTEERVTLTGKVSPVSMGTKLTLDGESVALNNGSFKVTVALELGENSFTLEAKNTYGVRDNKVVRITRTEPEPEPSPEPVPSPAPDPEPTKEPEPSKQPEPTKDPEPSTEPGREVIDSGKCGSNVTWVLYVDGELVISGSGKMQDYKCNYTTDGVPINLTTPWYDIRSDITSVTVSEGVTGIGDWAFGFCKDLLRTNLPNTLKTIGEKAFYGSALSRVNIPYGVVSIGSDSFRLTNLKSVVIPATVTRIRSGTFYHSGLTSITIPDSVTNIDEEAFVMPDLKDIYYTGSKEQWEEISIDDINDSLFNATIHFNSTGN